MKVCYHMISDHPIIFHSSLLFKASKILCKIFYVKEEKNLQLCIMSTHLHILSTKYQHTSTFHNAQSNMKGSLDFKEQKGNHLSIILFFTFYIIVYYFI